MKNFAAYVYIRAVYYIDARRKCSAESILKLTVTCYIHTPNHVVRALRACTVDSTSVFIINALRLMISVICPHTYMSLLGIVLLFGKYEPCDYS